MKTFLSVLFAALVSSNGSTAGELERLPYNNPGLVVDLGVGLWAWPLPMDYDGDGDLDLVVSCSDKPYNGVYLFENPGPGTPAPGGEKMPVFKPAVRLGKGYANIQPSYVGKDVRLLVPGAEIVDFRAAGFEKTTKIHATSNVHGSKVRANQWRYVDYDGDDLLDLVVGVGDWAAYGWDNAYNKAGEWTNGPLHGYVYLLHNRGTDDKPDYAEHVKLQAGGRDIDVFGMPSPSLADFDGDGDLDLLCGEFLDGFTYFQNVGSRSQPRYARGRRLSIRMDLQMITPVAIDWDGDGDMDLVVGDEDGRVALVEHTGKIVNGLPQFLRPAYFKQEAADVKFGALVTPVGFDWDGDGDDDIIAGNTAGYVGFIENLGGAPGSPGAPGGRPKWAAVRRLKADGREIRIMAGPNGSIQGPAEAKWGYTTLSVADWNHDDLPDLIVNNIWGKVHWHQNVGTRAEPLLTSARLIEVEWPAEPPKPEWTWWQPQGRELVTQWRTTPCVLDLTGDGLNDLAMLDHEGYLALFERKRDSGGLRLSPGRRVFVDEAGQPLRLNEKIAGGSGRRKLCFADWDGDGRIDLLVNSVNADWYRNVSAPGSDLKDAGRITLKHMGKMHERLLAGHTTSPTVVDFNRDKVPDLLIGAEDGYLYHATNPRSAQVPGAGGR